MTTRSADGMAGKARARSGPETTSTFRPGVNFFASASQLRTSDVGQTMSAGPLSRGRLSQVSVWSVLPRPISSARSPASPAFSRKRIQ